MDEQLARPVWNGEKNVFNRETLGKRGGGAVGKGGEGEGEGVVEGKGRVVGGRPRGCVKGAGG